MTRSRTGTGTWMLDAQLGAIIDAIPEGITVQDRMGRVVFANAAGAALCGFASADALLRASLPEVMSKFAMTGEDGCPFPMAELPGRKALAEGKPAEAILSVRELKNDRERWTHVKAIPIKGEDGTAAFALNIFHDITEKRHKEEQDAFLLKAAELLSSSLDYDTTLRSVAQLVVPRLAEWCVIHIVEKDGEIRQITTAHADPEMVEYARTLNEKYPLDYDAPGGIREIVRTGKSVFVPVITDTMLLSGAHDEEHLRILRELRLSSVMEVPLIAGGRVLGVIAFCTVGGKTYTEKDLAFAQTLAVRMALAMDHARLFRDLRETERQVRLFNEELEEKVRERTLELEAARAADRANLQRLRNMIENMPLAAKILDEEYRIAQANTLLYTFFHLDSARIDVIGMRWGQFQELVIGQILDKAEYRRQNALFHETHETVLGQEVRLTDGRVLVRDYIPMYEEGTFHGSLLLYRDVTQERRIDATKSEFMSLASHQLRTPLTSIRWTFGRLIKNLSGKIGSAEMELLEEGRQSAGRMSSTIRTMLQIALIQAGKVKPERADIALKALLEEIAGNVRPESERKEQALSIVCEGEVRIRTDEKLLKEVLLNLTGNAVKYTPERGEIFLSAEKETHRVMIHVRDTGYGIPAHQQEKIFQKFFRGDNIVGKDTEGTGLGLYLVSLIADLLGARVEFTSTEGRGTTFTLVFPAA